MCVWGWSGVEIIGVEPGSEILLQLRHELQVRQLRAALRPTLNRNWWRSLALRPASGLPSARSLLASYSSPGVSSCVMRRAGRVAGELALHQCQLS